MATITNSLNNATNFLTSTTGLTATTGDITATLGNVVLTEGQLILGTSSGTDGQIPIAASSGNPSWATLTSTGGTITFTPGANTLNLEAAGGGIKWSAVTSDLTASSNTGLITESGSRLVVTLPATAALGDVVIVQGFASGGWQIAQGGDNTQIFLGNQATAPGAGNGYLSSTQEEDSVSLVCVEPVGNAWCVYSCIGNILVYPY